MPIFKLFDLKNISYYKTGGVCETLYQPESKSELQEALKKIKASRHPFFVLGSGSNSLVSDKEWIGSVLNLSKMKKLELIDENKILAGAGIDNSELAEFALSKKLSGLSWMYGLPGSLGATVRMNARCYGGEISQVVSKVKAFTPSGEEKIYTSSPSDKDVFRSYKDTIFMDNYEIVSEIELTLKRGLSSEIKEKMFSCFEDRKAKGQFLNPSCGCVFKNDYRPEVSIPSGYLLDAAQLKGTKVGEAIVSQNHANFVLNTGSAKSSDILALTFLMREKVWEKFGVWLQYEMETLGEFSKDEKEKFLEKRKETFKVKDLNELRKKFQSA